MHVLPGRKLKKLQFTILFGQWRGEESPYARKGKWIDDLMGK